MFDVHVKHARMQYAAEDTLDFVPPWYGQRMKALGEHRCAAIALTGPVAPRIMDGIDPARLARDLLPQVRESIEIVNHRTANWTAAPCPTQSWAELVHPELPPQDAFERLWHDVTHVCRVDEPDPVAAWEQRIGDLLSIAGKLDELRLDALRFEGPGTESDRRPVPVGPLAVRAPAHRRRHRARAQPPHRGGVHDARSFAGRGMGALD